MLKLPQNTDGFFVTNVLDDGGRVAIPSAVFRMQTIYTMVGIGEITGRQEHDTIKFSQLDSEVKIGFIREQLYLLKTYPAVLSVYAPFATKMRELRDIDGSGVQLIPYKSLAFREGVLERHTVIINDAELVLMTPYKREVQSGNGNLYFFLKSLTTQAIARIPMPNTYEDGQFCIGTGVVFDTTLPPSEHIDAVYQCLVFDQYNADLHNSSHIRNTWEKQEDGTFVMTKDFDECDPILNETLIKAML